MIIHAAGESGPATAHTHAVALHASPEQLSTLEVQLTEAGVSFSAIREPDPPWNGALLAIGINPMPREPIRGLVRHLALVR